jgi:hypothetical protein
MFLYTNNDPPQKKLRRQSHLCEPQKKKTLNLAKELKTLYAENVKLRWKKFKKIQINEKISHVH